MKKVLSGILVFAIALTIIIAGASTKTSAIDTNTLTGVVIGDSIAEGVPSHSRIHAPVGINPVTNKPMYGYVPNYFEDKGSIGYHISNTLNIPVFNHGITSERTSSIRLRWNRDVLAQTTNLIPSSTLTKKPDFVVIICGINDIVFYSPVIPVTDSENNLEFMIDSAVSNNIKPIVFNLGIRINITDDQRSKIKEINTLLANKKKDTPTMTLIDFRSFSALGDNIPNTTYISDGLHPNALGYSELAKKVINEAGLNVYQQPTPTATPTATPAPTATPTPVAVTGITLNKTICKLNVGGTIQLATTIMPSNATIKTVKWTSGNTNVATVSSTGKITAKARGYATITVTSVSGSIKAVCKVTVIQPVKKVILNKKTLSLKKGGKYRLKATVLPSNANNKRITWKSGNKSIVTVSSTGLVKGIKKGKAYITVCTVDGRKIAKCLVTVRG